MKILILVPMLALVSCSDTVDKEVEKPVVSQKEKINKDHILKGYQDNLQKAKDVEKEVLKAAERKKKAIDDASR